MAAIHCPRAGPYIPIADPLLQGFIPLTGSLWKKASKFISILNNYPLFNEKEAEYAIHIANCFHTQATSLGLEQELKLNSQILRDRIRVSPNDLGLMKVIEHIKKVMAIVYEQMSIVLDGIRVTSQVPEIGKHFAVCRLPKDAMQFANDLLNIKTNTRQVHEKIIDSHFGMIQHETYNNRHYVTKTAKRARDNVQLYNEAKMTNAFPHPGIMSMRYLRTYNGARQGYFDVGVRDLLNCHPKLIIDNIHDIIRFSLEAIGYLHSWGLAHRDIKPENFMLVSEVRKVWNEEINDYQTRQVTIVKAIDFGVANVIGKFGLGAGTYLFFSPRLANISVDKEYRIDSSDDAWAMGVMIYQLLTRKTWFMPLKKSKNFKDVLKKLRPPTGCFCFKSKVLTQARIDSAIKEISDPEKFSYLNHRYNKRTIAVFQKLLRDLLRLDASQRSSIPEVFEALYPTEVSTHLDPQFKKDVSAIMIQALARGYITRKHIAHRRAA